MAPADQTASLLSQRSAEAADALWRFQLRKEHAALIDKLEECSKAIQDCSSESKRQSHDQDERLAELEARFLKMEKVQKDARKVCERYYDEVITLKRKITEFVEQDFSYDAIIGPQESTVQHQRLVSTAGQSHTNLATAIRPHHLDPTLVASNLITSDPTPTISSQVTTLIDASTINGPRASSPSKDYLELRNLSDNPATRHQGHQISEMPHLRQGIHQSLESYHSSATHTLAKLTLSIGMEIEFVASFLGGIREINNQEKLIKQLQKTCPSARKDGKVQILCKWVEVGHALRLTNLAKCGLLDATQSTKRRKRILLLPELMESGMMR
ncbi:hypothetical protein B0O99DRAFT_74148 [Bisporella sp. PMI_857]|nr:hypothetical protein B0O99DRAFT_74148 [Bisporella sp. PMI_857]